MTCNMFQFRFGVAVVTVIVVFDVLSLSLGAGKVPPSDACVRPGGGIGTCKTLAKCEPLFGLLVEGRSRPRPWIIDLLKMSHCGYEGKDPVVCCPVGIRPKEPRPKDPRGNENRPVKKQPLGKFLNKSCGTIETLDKVIGGSTAALHEFPWMALIGYETRFGVQFRCGGSLISSRYVLTAAHCVTTLKDIYPTSVRLGEHNLDSSEDCGDTNDDCSSSAIDIPIEELVPHPGYYKPELRHDIALIRLAKRVEFVDYIRPICLPLKSEFSEPLRNERAVVAGWGTAEIGSSSQILRKVTLPIVPLSECSRVYRTKVPITEYQICAGGEDRKDSCNGDSGGPLQIVGLNPSGQPAYIQHGVVSFGPRMCGTKGMPGVYTRVVRYVDWIVENVKD